MGYFKMGNENLFIIDAEETFLLAEIFRRTGKAILDPIINRRLSFLRQLWDRFRIKPQSNPDGFSIIPGYLLRGIAVEFYLKCLMLLDNRGVPPSSNHHTLFRRLAQETRTQLTDLYIEQKLGPIDHTTNRLLPLESLLERTTDRLTAIRHEHMRTADTNSRKCLFSYAAGEAARLIILDRQPKWICHTLES